MRFSRLLCLGSTPAAEIAARELENRGIPVTGDTGGEFDAILLDTPSFRPGGMLRSGEEPEILNPMLQRNPVVIGGNLTHPYLTGCKAMDLLTDDTYLAGNAAITAQCVLPIAASALSVTLGESHPLIIGWGRIGKCIAQLLRGLGAEVTVFARKSADRAILKALGYNGIAADNIRFEDYRLVINTVPVPLFGSEKQHITAETVLIDLASEKVLPGDNVLWAKGLPGIHAPESSGKLIAQTILRLREEAVQ